MSKLRMKSTTSIMDSKHIQFLLFVSFLLIPNINCGCPVGQIIHGDICCKPVLHCPTDHYVKTCNRNGNCDECVACHGKQRNPYITSSFDLKSCYENNCPADAFPVSKSKCACSLHSGSYGDHPHFCRLSSEVCKEGEELTNSGKCESCENNYYKYWTGLAYCIKQPNCSMIGTFQTPGNLTTPKICNAFKDECSPKRSPPLPASMKPKPTTATTTTTMKTTITTTPTATQKTQNLTTKTKQRTSFDKTTEPRGIPFWPRTPKKEQTSTSWRLPALTTKDYTKTSSHKATPSPRILFRDKYIYIMCICVLSIFIIILVIYISLLKYNAFKKRKKHEGNYQQINYQKNVSPNQTQRPLPKKPSSNNLIDTYMEMGKTNATLGRSVPYIISSPYVPSTLSRLIQQPGGDIPVLHPIYQQNHEAMWNLLHCSPPRQESNASGEDEVNAMVLENSLTLQDFSVNQETALKVPDNGEPNGFEPTTATEQIRVEPVRIEPYRGDLDPNNHDALSILSNYSPPPIQWIQQSQATQMGIVHPQLVQYAQTLNRTRSREHV